MVLIRKLNSLWGCACECECSFTLHAQNAAEFQTNVSVTGIHRLLVTNKGRSAFPSTNCQGQRQASHAVPIVASCAGDERVGFF